MVDLVELSGSDHVGTDVVLYVLKVRLAGEEGSYVFEDASTEVVHADDLVALGEEPLAEVAADETGCAGDQRPQSSGPWPSPCHIHVRIPCRGVLPPGRPKHRARSGRPR